MTTPRQVASIVAYNAADGTIIQVHTPDGHPEGRGSAVLHVSDRDLLDSLSEMVDGLSDTPERAS